MRPPGRRAAAVLVALAVGLGASLPVAASDGAPRARHHKKAKRCTGGHRFRSIVGRCTMGKRHKPGGTTSTTGSVPAVLPFPPAGESGAGGGGSVSSGGSASSGGGAVSGGGVTDPGAGSTTTTTTTGSDPGPPPEDPCGAFLGVTAKDNPSTSPLPFAFKLSRTCLHAGTITVQLVNSAMDAHNLHLRPASGPGPDYAIPDTDPDGVNQRTLDLSPGTWHLYCSLPDHEAEGMSRDIEVR